MAWVLTIQRQLQASLQRAPRTLSIAYLLNPDQPDAFASLPWLTRVRERYELWENVHCITYRHVPKHHLAHFRAPSAETPTVASARKPS